jgi:integrase
LTPFQNKPGGPFMVWVPSSTGAKKRRSTGTADAQTAKGVAALVARLRRQRRWDLLDPAAAGDVALGRLYDADELGTLDELAQTLKDVDLSPLVSEWGRHADPKYVKQVRRLIPEGRRFPRSSFTTSKISAFLAGLKDARAHQQKEKLASGSTRNRYHAALSEFAKWLVEREIIPTNVLRDVKRSRENPSKIVHYGPQDARRLIESLWGSDHRALEALMAVTGIEWSAATPLTRADFNLSHRRIFAQGTKTNYRTRYIYAMRATEWEWAWALVERHVKKFTPNQRVFAELPHGAAIAEHQRACVRQHLPMTTLHDWRHTYAVNALKAGTNPRYVKQNLGHSPRSALLETVYGVWIPDERERETEAQVTRRVTR